jgi:hypothetical protein
MRDHVLLVRPKRSLLVTAVVTSLALTTPLFAVLYWYTALHDGWHWVLATHIVIVVLCLLTLWRQTTVFVALTSDRLTGNGIFSRTVSVAISEVSGVALASVYDHDSAETTVQFVALDSSGRCRFRMRGQYWHLHDLERVATALGVPVSTDLPPLTDAEFFTSYPGSRYWFEPAR